MNSVKTTALVLLAILMFVSCKEKSTETNSDATAEIAAPKVKKEIPAENLQTASFTIKGMTCAIGCAKTIEQELNGLDGVQKANVDFDKEQAKVCFDKTVLSPEKLTKVVEATADGKTYSVSDMKF